MYKQYYVSYVSGDSTTYTEADRAAARNNIDAPSIADLDKKQDKLSDANISALNKLPDIIDTVDNLTTSADLWNADNELISTRAKTVDDMNDASKSADLTTVSAITSFIESKEYLTKKLIYVSNNQLIINNL